MVASSAADVERVRHAKDATGIRGFEDELKRAARRRRTASSTANLQPPKAEYTFGAYEAWELPGLQPPPAEALKLLYRLANDPGILGVMAAHRYKVGLLSEMPPEGKVGISPVCILGVNVNAGQEISLRLRTDDLKGFRKYERIRETLIHELAHMEYGEHDTNFKQLNSQLGRECMAINGRYLAGRSLLGEGGMGPYAADGVAAASELDAAWLLEDENDVMAATARMSGRTLRQLAAAGTADAGAGAGASGRGVGAGAAGIGAPPSVRAAAAAAALTRVAVAAAAQAAPAAEAGPGAPALAQTDGRSSHPGADVLVAAAGAAEAVAASASASSGDEGAEAASDVRRFEHFDAETDEAEAAARRLGSIDDQGPEQLPLDEHGPVAAAADDSTGGDGAAGVLSMPVRGGGEAAGPALTVPADSHGQAVPVAAPAPARECEQVDSLLLLEQPGGDAAPRAVAAAGKGVGAAPLDGSPAAPAGLPHRTSVATPPAAGAGAATTASATPTAPAAPPVRLVVTPPSELLGPADGPSGGMEAEGAGVAGSGGTEDVVRQKVRQAWAAVMLLVSAAAPEAAPHSASQASRPASQATPPDSHTPAAHSSSPPPIGPAVAVTEPVSAADVAAALDTLATLLGNAAGSGREERYRRVRLGNAAFQRRVGRLPGGLDLLRVAGFGEEGSGPEAVLRLRRDDPGLLWLVLSVVQEAREQVAAQVAASAEEGRS